MKNKLKKFFGVLSEETGRKIEKSISKSRKINRKMKKKRIKNILRRLKDLR